MNGKTTEIGRFLDFKRLPIACARACDDFSGEVTNMVEKKKKKPTEKKPREEY